MLLLAALIITLGGTIKDLSACLPLDIKPGDVVSVETLERDGVKQLKKVTVKDKLKQLGGRCLKGKLVDGSGKEIRFYKLTGCWGNPPADYQEILDRQTHELAELKKKYQVIELTCNPAGTQIY